MSSNDSITHPSRRSFLKGSLAVAGGIATAGAVKASDTSQKTKYKQLPDEWRNKQSGMTYRRLGRTGLMVSEMVIGGSSKVSNFPGKTGFFKEAIDSGVNYLDTATAYGRGQSEEGWGELFEQGYRDKVFIATKISGYNSFITNLCDELYQSLSADKQAKVNKMAEELIAEREVTKPGYFFKFFRSHGNEVEGAYRNYVVRREYGFQSKWKKIVEDKMRESVEASLTRMKTDHIDVLHFPHGCRMPEELMDEIHLEMTEKFKKEGKIRFTGFSSHTDQPRVLYKAAELGHIDMAMVAYNIANQGAMEPAIAAAVNAGMGIVGMKAAATISPIQEGMEVPQWRIEKLNTAIPGDMPLPEKAYLWVLQNPKISAVISEINDADMMRQNLALIGKRVEINLV